MIHAILFSMAKILRVIGLFLVIAPLSAMFSEPFYAALLHQFNLDTERWAGPFVTGLFTAFATDWFRYASILAIGLGIGVWAHWLASRADMQRQEGKDQSLVGLINKLKTLKYDLRDLDQSNQSVLTEDEKYPIPILLQQKYRSIAIGLKQMGVSTPTMDGLYGRTYTGVVITFIDTVVPYLSAGQVSDARREAVQFTNVFNLNKQSLLESLAGTQA